MSRSQSAALKDEAHSAHEALQSGASNSVLSDEELQHIRINSLEAPYDPKNAPIPERWDREHVALRLTEAMKTLSKTPNIRKPRQPGNHFPPSRPDYDVMVDWESMGYVEKTERYADLNFVADRPSIQDLTRMDICMGWLQTLRAHDSGLAVTLTHWLIRKSQDRPIKDLCREKGWSFTGFYRRRDQALDFISRHLNARYVSVF